MRSPHALSRGNAALSTSATRAPPRANTRAAMLPAGPDPTTSTSKRLSVIALSSCEPELYCQAPRRTRAENGCRSEPLRPGLVPAAPASLRRARRAAVARTERALETRDDRARRRRRSERRSSTLPPGPQASRSRSPARTERTDHGYRHHRGDAATRTRGASREPEAPDRVRLVVGQAERLPFPDDSFDALTFTYLLRYVADPAATLRELARVLKPGAAIASLEFSVPAEPVLAVLVVALHARRACRLRAISRAVVSGAESDAFSDPTSRRTTSATRWRGPSERGRTPDS